MEESIILITVDEIMTFFGISRSSAYRIISDLNQSLKEKDIVLSKERHPVNSSTKTTTFIIRR